MNDLLALIETGAPAAALTGGALVARQRAPRLYWSTVGLPAALARIGHDWADTMEACGLVTEPPMWKLFLTRGTEQGQPVRPAAPKVRRVLVSTLGLTIRIRLTPGMATEDVAKATEALRHAWRVHSVHVAEVRPGIVDLRITGFDVLRRVVLPSRMAAKATGLLRVPVAMGDDGRVWERDYRRAPHGLTLGATESGKSVFARNMVHGLATQPVAIAGIDCKLGVEQRPFAPRLSALATDADAALDLLRVLVGGVMADRYDLIRSHLGIPGSVAASDITADIWGLPAKVRPAPLVLVVDEIAELFLGATKAEKLRAEETVQLLIRYAQLARAAGMYLEVMGQRLGSELGKGATLLRSQLTNRVVHRVNDTESAKMGLGDISELAVSAATQIDPAMPGTAIVGNTSGRWQRIRTPLRTLSETAALCAKTAHLVPDLPALDPFRPVPPMPKHAPILVPAPAVATP